MRDANNFATGYGRYTCHNCKKSTRDTGTGAAGCELCDTCYDDAGEENHHSDNHDSSKGVDTLYRGGPCHFCEAEIKAAADKPEIVTLYDVVVMSETKTEVFGLIKLMRVSNGTFIVGNVKGLIPDVTDQQSFDDVKDALKEYTDRVAGAALGQINN